jgi:type I restriction enzyme S subunit
MEEEVDIEVDIELADLPGGWAWTTLGDVCNKPQYGWTTKADKERGEIKLLRTTDITSGDIDWSTVPFCTEIPEDLDKYLVEPGDIVISRAGSVGVSYLLTVVEPAVFASYLIRFRPKAGIDERYLYHYLQSTTYWTAIGASKAGIAVPNVNAKKLARVPFPLAPLPEQRRIVSAIETQLGRLDAAVARLHAAKARLKRYKQAVLKAALDEAIEEADGLAVRLDEIADLCLGKMLDKQKNKGTPHSYLRNINVRWDSFDTDDLHQMPFEDHEHERYGLEVGDLVVCEGGEPGRCAVWDGKIPDMKIQKALHRVRLSSQADPHFVMYSLLFSAWSGAITKYYTGTTIKHLTGKSLASFQLVLPSVKVQRRLVAGIRKAFSATDETEATLDAQLVQAGRLRQAVLKRAFEGRLV